MTKPLDWMQLFAAEAPRLTRFLRRFGSAISPEDVAQESFARLCAADPARLNSPKAYLFQTARHLAIDHVRRARAAPMRAVADIEAVNVASPARSPEDEIVSAEQAAAVRDALAALSPPQRRALLMSKVEGRSTRDIATELGICQRQVQRLIADAILACQGRLSENGDNTSSKR